LYIIILDKIWNIKKIYKIDNININSCNKMEIRYFTKVGDATIIKKDVMPYQITKKKCTSYLDIFYPKIEPTDQILERCICIFNMLIKYADEYQNMYDGKVLLREDYPWSEEVMFNTPLEIFHIVIRNKIFVELGDPNQSFNPVPLFDLLVSDNMMPSEWWRMSYNYDDLYQAVLDASNRLNQPLPSELIEIILCMAHHQYNV
jgi:hypothetical protein